MLKHANLWGRFPSLLLLAFAPAAMTAAPITFSDGFSPSPSPLWSSYAGSWAATHGNFFAEIPNTNPLSLAVLPFGLTDYVVSVTVNNLGDGGIWLRSDGTNQNGLLLVVGGDGYGQGSRGPDSGRSIYFHVVQNGSFGAELSRVTGVFDPGNTYDIRVAVSGDSYAAYVGGSVSPVTIFTTSMFSSGQVGLYDDQPNTVTGAGFGAKQSFSNFRLEGTLASVPEPGTEGLIGYGLAALALVSGMCRRRRGRGRCNQE
jgi:hypothetical protein